MGARVLLAPSQTVSIYDQLCLRQLWFSSPVDGLCFGGFRVSDSSSEHEPRYESTKVG